MNVNVEIKNIAQIKAAFRRSPYIMTKNLSKAIGRVSATVQREAIHLVPVKTGFLERSHIIKFESPLRATVVPTAKYAYWVHEGHKQEVGRFVPAINARLVKPYVKGNPWLANAVEITQGYTDTEFEKAVQDTLDTIGRSV